MRNNHHWPPCMPPFATALTAGVFEAEFCLGMVGAVVRGASPMACAVEYSALSS
jgi:hypothetical protein